MAEAVEVTPSFRELAVRLKAGEKELWKAANRNIRAATAPARPAVRDSMRTNLPKRGGLNEWAASATVSTSVLTGERTAGVRIRVRKRGHDMQDLDRGEVRHPLYGNRDHWYTTPVHPGTISRPLYALKPAVGAACYAAMREAAAAAGFH